MTVRQAHINDLDNILQVVEQARQMMRETGNMTQWSNGYPSAQTILDDIQSGHGFVIAHDGRTVGYFHFSHGQSPEPTYSVIKNGQWLNDKPYGVIHRLASGRSVKGIAKAAFDYAFSAIDTIRVDTHRDNLPMQNFLKKNGFAYCGIIYVNDGTPRDAFHKTIST
ncbi:MAG TPA: GNAT family N-acetyltransferase [Flavobacterium sp.]|nr:GNAT family N-acetyltransferase [Flavobacterium sp.]